MIIRISSGIHAPIECEAAVKLFAEAMKHDFPDAKIIEQNDSKQFSNGRCCRSITMQIDCMKEPINGTIEWICKSEYRPNCKRKNWFIDVSTLETTEQIEVDDEFAFETFHSSGNGGQNVNKVETGVRCIHLATGVSATSTKERSQLMNKKDAKAKVIGIINKMNIDSRNSDKNSAWMETNNLIKGNPIRVYEGKEFKRKK